MYSLDELIEIIVRGYGNVNKFSKLLPICIESFIPASSSLATCAAPACANTMMRHGCGPVSFRLNRVCVNKLEKKKKQEVSSS